MAKPKARMRTSFMAYSMLRRLQHVKAHAKNLLKRAGRASGRVFFRECERPISLRLTFFRNPGAGVHTLLRQSPGMPVIDISGQSCSGFGQSGSDMAANYSISEPAPSPASSNLVGEGTHHLFTGFNYGRRIAAFTLVEAMIASGIMVLFAAACLSSVVVSQVSVRKAKEEAIVIDFLTKYTENIKALPFTSVYTGAPINVYYNGANGAPLINIPPNGTPVSINTTAYKTFYPDLLWFNNRNPTMTVTLTQTTISGTLHDIEVNVKVDWDPPISKGGRQEVQVDFLRTKDTTQL
jgi:hypothetical protein